MLMGARNADDLPDMVVKLDNESIQELVDEIEKRLIKLWKG